MYKGIYIGIRALVALVAFFTVHHLFLTPPLIDSGGARGNVYSSCHAVGWSFNNDLDPLVTDSFDVESTEKVQEYVDGALSYKMEVNDEIRRDIQRLCREAHHERGIVIIVATIFFAVVFLSVPKPRRSCNCAGTRETSSGARQKAAAGGENAAFMAGERDTALGDRNETDFRRGTESS